MNSIKNDGVIPDEDAFEAGIKAFAEQFQTSDGSAPSPTPRPRAMPRPSSSTPTPPCPKRHHRDEDWVTHAGR